MNRATATALAGAALGIVVGLIIAIFPAGSTPQSQPEIINMPKTQQISPEQLYLDDVLPHLSPDREHDLEGLIDAGQNGVCGVWSDPAASRPAAIDLLLRTEPYSLTEATAIYESAVEHLC